MFPGRRGTLGGLAITFDPFGFLFFLEVGGNWTLGTLASLDGANGDDPKKLVVDSSGSLYGITWRGGANDLGTVFELSNETSGWTVHTLVSFNGQNGENPLSLISDPSGNLYGTTYHGGGTGAGIVFELSRQGGSNWAFTTLAALDGHDGAGSTGLAVGSSGEVYGITGHSVFELSPGSGSTWSFSTIKTFSDYLGGDPVLDRAGNLYFIANFSLLELIKSGGSSDWDITTLASSPKIPAAGLTIDAQGNLYGIAPGGLGNDTGSIVELSRPAGSSPTLTTLASFVAFSSGQEGGLVLDPQGNLYGTTSSGGINGGTIFELDKASGTLSPIFRLNGDQTIPTGLVRDPSGNLYGVTNDISGNGTVFELSKGNDSDWVYSTIFEGVSGPFGDLLLDPTGNLYGTTHGGGANGYGTVFQLARGADASWTLNTLASFTAVNAGLVMDADGNIYGTTSNGGANGGGSIFELSKGGNSGWSLRTLMSFDGINGAPPQAGLVIDPVGNLYGVTRLGLFELAKGIGGEWTLRTLALINGRPDGPLTRDGNGNLFLTVRTFNTEEGLNPGQVFEWAAGTGSLRALWGDLLWPNPQLAVDTGGNVYATTGNGGAAGFGTLVELSAPQVIGAVWIDANHNGVFDAGERGLANVQVFVDVNNNGHPDNGEPSTTTDDDGAYTFDGLNPGSYTVRQVLPGGYATSAPLGYSEVVRVEAAAHANGPDFGDVDLFSTTLDFAYLLTLAQHYLRPGTFADGDLNGDGSVNFADLLLLAQSYGHNPPAPAVAAASTDSANLLLKWKRLR